MSDYTRITRECPVSQLTSELRQALREYFQAHDLGELTEAVLACYETVSEKKDAGRLVAWLNDKTDNTTHLGLLLTPDRLIWARYGDQTGTRVISAMLRDIQVKVYNSRLTQDTGLEVNGYIEGMRGRMKGYLGLESEEIAQRFCNQVKQEIEKIVPPRKRRVPWFFRGKDD